jgi:predicted metalloprotease with PDZ domain
MKNKIIAFLITLLITGQSFAVENGDKYTFVLDLTVVENDKLKVVLFTPDIAENEIIYSLPKIIPGTYRIADYGRFVSELKAFDKNGNELVTSHPDDNSWKIFNANKMVKLTYWIEDVIDTELGSPIIYPMATTNIEEGKNFIINTPGFFGYFEGKKKLPIALNIVRPENFFGSTGLVLDNNISTRIDREEIEAGKELDCFRIENYDRLVDSPLMYSEPDTVIIKVSNTEVLISVISLINIFLFMEDWNTRIHLFTICPKNQFRHFMER